MHGKFDADKIASFLRIKPGEFIYYRENEEAKVQELKWVAVGKYYMEKIEDNNDL